MVKRNLCVLWLWMSLLTRKITDEGYQTVQRGKVVRCTHDMVARKLGAYLHHEISLLELGDWANAAMMEDAFEEAYYDTIRDAVARLGLADVQALGSPGKIALASSSNWVRYPCGDRRCLRLRYAQAAYEMSSFPLGTLLSLSVPHS
jgi:hypothetical protein